MQQVFKLNLRSDFTEAKQKCKRQRDEHTAINGHGNKPIPPGQQVRQRLDQQFEGFEEYDYRLEARTGWRYYPSSRTDAIIFVITLAKSPPTTNKRSRCSEAKSLRRDQTCRRAGQMRWIPPITEETLEIGCKYGAEGIQNFLKGEAEKWRRSSASQSRKPKTAFGDGEGGARSSHRGKSDSCLPGHGEAVGQGYEN